jgi:hypothetical protein
MSDNAADRPTNAASAGGKRSGVPGLAANRRPTDSRRQLLPRRATKILTVARPDAS